MANCSPLNSGAPIYLGCAPVGRLAGSRCSIRHARSLQVMYLEHSHLDLIATDESQRACAAQARNSQALQPDTSAV